MLLLFTLNASTPFQCDQADNVVRRADLLVLAYHWDSVVCDLISRGLAVVADHRKWAPAADLALWCLNANANRRPQGIDEVLNHKFFNPSGELRYLESTEELWDEFLQRQAAALHEAIGQKDSTAVRELFSRGGVHMGMIDHSVHGSTIQPLHRAAFTGDAKVVRVLLAEIPTSCPQDVKFKILDCQTALDYSPYLLACKCGHNEVAQMLLMEGCSETLMNSSKRTGKKLADAFQRELELSSVHPWNRGDQLHVVAKDLEEFFDKAKSELNEHVHAGMRVWNSKLLVWQLCKEQMQALQARVKQLVLIHSCAHVGTYPLRVRMCCVHAVSGHMGTHAMRRCKPCTLTNTHTLARKKARKHACTHAHTRTHLCMHMRVHTHAHAHASTQACAANKHACMCAGGERFRHRPALH